PRSARIARLRLALLARDACGLRRVKAPAAKELPDQPMLGIRDFSHQIVLNRPELTSRPFDRIGYEIDRSLCRRPRPRGLRIGSGRAATADRRDRDGCGRSPRRPCPGLAAGEEL